MEVAGYLAGKGPGTPYSRSRAKSVVTQQITGDITGLASKVLDELGTQGMPFTLEGTTVQVPSDKGDVIATLTKVRKSEPPKGAKMLVYQLTFNEPGKQDRQVSELTAKTEGIIPVLPGPPLV
jgi:hypothetical protein